MCVDNFWIMSHEKKWNACNETWWDKPSNGTSYPTKRLYGRYVRIERCHISCLEKFKIFWICKKKSHNTIEERMEYFWKTKTEMSRTRELQGCLYRVLHKSGVPYCLNSISLCEIVDATCAINNAFWTTSTMATCAHSLKTNFKKFF